MKKRTSNVILNILLFGCLGLFLFSAWKVYGYLREYHKGEASYETVLEKAIVIPDTDSAETEKEVVLPVLDWDALYGMNEDLLGFLYIPDTVIEYPIVRGRDNAYYLTHTFTGETNKCGCIFMDVANQEDFTSDNTILYGHNMKTRKMFGSLREYEKKEYWEEHPYIYILTRDNVMVYEIFATYKTTAVSETYTLEFGSEDNFSDYLTASQRSAYYDTGVEVTVKDHLLTLSTCTSDSEDGRRVVQARLSELKENSYEE